MPGVWTWSGIELAHFHQLLDLGHRHLAAGGDHRVEVARGLAIDEVAGLVALPGLDDGQVGADRVLEHVFAAVERARLLAFGELGAVGGARVEARDAGAAGAEFFRQRALRRELQFELSGQHLALELLVLADVGGDHLLHLARLQQQPHAEVVHARVVAGDGEALHAAFHQRGDQVLGNAAQPEAAGGDGHVVLQQAGQGRFRVRIHFAHFTCSLSKFMPAFPRRS